MRACTEEMFLKDVASHEMNVLLDNGIHRCLRFKQPGSSNMWFDVVTWPGFLAYTGDMGSFVFTRLEDMFQFFRSRDGKLAINLSYWSEKLEAVDSHCHTPGHKQYSEEKLKGLIDEHVSGWIDDNELSKDDATTLRLAVKEDVLRYLDDSEGDSINAVRNFSCEIDGHKFEFQDSWEWDCREYTFRFIWCCYAIVWAINKYDDSKTGKEMVKQNGE